MSFQQDQSQLPQLPASRVLPSAASDPFGTQQSLSQAQLQGQPSEFQTSSQIPIATGILPRSPSGRALSPSMRPLSPHGHAVPFPTQPFPPQGYNPTASWSGGAQTLPPGAMGRMVEGPQINRSTSPSPSNRMQGQHLQASMPPMGQAQGQIRSLPSERIMQMRDDNQRRGEAPAPAPPAVFTTAAVPQQQDASSFAGDMEGDEATSTSGYQASRMQPQFSGVTLESPSESATVPSQQPPMSSTNYETQELVRQAKQRVREAEESEAYILQQHELRAKQIHDLEQEIQHMRAGQGQGAQGTSVQGQTMNELQQHLEIAKNAEVTYQRTLKEQEAALEDHAREIQRSRNSEAQLQQTVEFHQSAQLDLEQRHAEAQREKETHMKIAEDRAIALQQTQTQATVGKQELERKHNELARALDRKDNQLKNMEDAYQNQLVEERRQKNALQDVLDAESNAKDFHQQQNASNQEQIGNLQNELNYLKSSETFHKRQGDLHRKEAQRLGRLRQEDAPPKPPIRMPLKALEERIMHLACFMMMGVCSLPIIGAIALLADENYKFWLGVMWPWMVIGGCVFVFLLFVFTMQMLLQFAQAEHRSQFTMAFTWATFAALLGVILVPMSLMANKEALNIASTISQGCLTAMPQSEMLVDYSQVLYNIRLSTNCTGATSVTECHGWSENKYTMYLQYLESDFHCGPLCPESPPPASAVAAPSMYNTPMPTMKPTIAPPPMWGPPLQNALGPGGAFLQAGDSLKAVTVSQHQHGRQLSLPMQSGVMETALPHMQAKKLFSNGNTRMTCYPLIATRLQVLVSTFGGLWYWEGMGLIIISLLTSIYAGLYFALHGHMG